MEHHTIGRSISRFSQHTTWRLAPGGVLRKTTYRSPYGIRLLQMQLTFDTIWIMDEKIDEFHLAAWRAFLNAHAAVIDIIERELIEAGYLPLSEYDVLLALLEAPDHRLRMHELAREVVLS